MIFISHASTHNKVPSIFPSERNSPQTIISGIVQDEEGNTIPGVTVTIKSLSLDRIITAITNESGKYFFRNIPAGIYKISFKLEGFKEQIKENIILGPYAQLQLSPISMVSEMIDEEGGTQRDGPKIPVLTLSENKGLNSNMETSKKEKCEFYYAKKKIFAKNGIAEVGVIKKRLNNITEIPYEVEDYIKDGLNVSENYVYAIKIGNKIMLIRIQEISEDKIRFEYYIDIENEK